MRNAVIFLCVVLSLVSLPQPVNPAEYPEQIDYGTLTDQEREVFDAILEAAAAGVPVVRYRQPVNPDKLRTHLGLHYGRIKGAGRLFVVSGDTLLLDLEAFAEFEQHRETVNAWTDAALEQLHSGSTRSQLRQIARYIAENFSYSEDFLCGDYAILFYQMASRLGIESYLCFGYAVDELHVWNYAGGRYYDVTWYDSTGEWKYINSKDQWGRCSAINNMWEVIKP